MRERQEPPSGEPGVPGNPTAQRLALRADITTAVALSGLPAPLLAPAVAANGGGGDSGEAVAALLLDSLAPMPPHAPGRPEQRRPSALRRRLLRRVRASAAAARVMHTVHLVRGDEGGAARTIGGATLRPLYRAEAGRAARPGEPSAVTLLELPPGCRWPRSEAVTPGAAAALQREWLVLRGSVRIGSAGGTGTVALRSLDYHGVPAGHAAAADLLVAGREGALVLCRESPPVAGTAPEPVTSRAAEAVWSDYAPGVKRRMLWQQGEQAAMLYHGLPGAAVPHHAHAHDEECLMLAGDFFLDEVLLRPLDYQLAPAGSEHRVSCTDTGVVIYAHGDVQLDLR
ncbi:MAG: cupin domain-containing protein [Rubrivivax sp.]|nr:cupin domain-containing protein [Rubrivivax sp.]